jgi:hypothetical protein
MDLDPLSPCPPSGRQVLEQTWRDLESDRRFLKPSGALSVRDSLLSCLLTNHILYLLQDASLPFHSLTGVHWHATLLPGARKTQVAREPSG